MKIGHSAQASILCLTALVAVPGNVQAASPTGPSFDCTAAQGEVQALICARGELAALDRQLSQTYAAAGKHAGAGELARLKAEQRGWIKGRDECWKADDKPACIAGEYRTRIATLQATYRLAAARGPFHFACAGNPASELVVTYFQTDPATAIAEREEKSSLMFARPVASGTLYQGPNESLREHQGEVTLVWGYDVAEISCRQAR